MWRSTSKYRRVIWRCNEKYKREEPCSTPHVTEEDVRRMFVTAFNSVLAHRDELIRCCRLAQEALCDHAVIDREIRSLGQEAEVLAGLVRQTLHAAAGANQDECDAADKGNDYLNKHEEALRRIEGLKGLKWEKQGKKSLLDAYIRNILESGECIRAFDDRLWAVAVDMVTVIPDGVLLLRFRDGTEVPVGER